MPGALPALASRLTPVGAAPLRDYFTSGNLTEHLIHADLVRAVTLEAFIRIANNGQR